MHWIGIDVSKATLDLALSDDQGRILHEQQIANTDRAIKGLLNRWQRKYGLSKEDCLACLEPTGHYTITTLHTLVELELPTWLAHPRDIQKSIGVQRGKSDAIDARRIAEYARRFKDKARLFTADSLKLEKVKHLLTRRKQLVRERKRYHLQIKDWNPCLGEDLKKTFDRFAKKQIKVLEKAIGDVEAMIEQELAKDEQVKRQYELVRSVPGVGPVLGAYMLATTDGFKRFATPRALACQAGVVPFDYSSGTSLKSRPSVSQQADRDLKSLLHMAVLGVIQHPGDLQDYYLRKVAEGKAKMAVINALRNKLIHRIYAVLQRNEPYVLNYAPVHLRAAQNNPSIILANAME
jgi:transposase